MPHVCTTNHMKITSQCTRSISEKNRNGLRRWVFVRTLQIRHVSKDFGGFFSVSAMIDLSAVNEMFRLFSMNRGWCRKWSKYGFVWWLWGFFYFLVYVKHFYFMLKNTYWTNVCKRWCDAICLKLRTHVFGHIKKCNSFFIWMCN